MEVRSHAQPKKNKKPSPRKRILLVRWGWLFVGRKINRQLLFVRLGGGHLSLGFGQRRWNCGGHLHFFNGLALFLNPGVFAGFVTR
jgi:hypothetical protein